MTSSIFIRALMLSSFVLATPLAAAAATGFTGDYALTAATISTGGGGSIDISGLPATITLIGGDNGDSLGSDQLYQFNVHAAGTISFDWNYASQDCCGAVWDPFGYQLNGTFHAVVDLTNGLDGLGDPNQNGRFSLAVRAGDVFALDQNSFDDATGAATTIVSNFDGPVAGVPEPAAWGLLIMGFGAVGAAARRRRAQPSLQST